jgi:hypothetical protein
MSFSMGGQGSSKPREGRAGKDKGQGMGPGREQNGYPDILGREGKAEPRGRTHA